MNRLVAVLVALLVAVSCSDPTAPERSGDGDDVAFQISDGANEGNEHFYFLPPMVAPPSYSGTFDPTLRPEVQVCVWRLVDDECGPLLEMYTMDIGPGSETIRLSETEDELYIVNWHTEDILAAFPLRTDEVYRIRVLVEDYELGFADVVVASGGKELKNYRSGDIIPLIDGHRMPIKFRIEEGAVPAVIPPISAGGNHSCSLTPDGRAYCWGWNGAGQIGNGDFMDQSVPVAVAGGLAFMSISAGFYHTCAIATNGFAYCWGDNYNGELGIGTRIGDETLPRVVMGGHTFRSVAAGAVHSCGITVQDDAYCWGRSRDGEIGHGVFSYWELSPVAVAGGLKFSEISVGDYHTCGLTTDGDAYCWGSNNLGQLGNGETDYQPERAPVSVAGGHTFISVQAGGAYTCGLTTGGAAYCWGSNTYGTVGTGTTSYTETTPVAVSGGHVFQSLDAGRIHSCGVTSDGEVYCWGRNHYGQLGTGVVSYLEASPVAVSGGQRFARVDVGLIHTCGATISGDILCWGANYQAQLGNGEISFGEPVPVPVAGFGGSTP